MAIDGSLIRQAAAVPIRNGRLCLVTSSSGKRWVVPKGCCEPGKSACEIALQEAWEEAGLTGILQRNPVGSYVYEKLGSTHHVLVFVLQVTQAAEFWPEGALRQRAWLSPAHALERIDDSALRAVVRSALRSLKRESWAAR